MIIVSLLGGQISNSMQVMTRSQRRIGTFNLVLLSRPKSSPSWDILTIKVYLKLNKQLQRNAGTSFAPPALCLVRLPRPPHASQWQVGSQPLAGEHPNYQVEQENKQTNFHKNKQPLAGEHTGHQVEQAHKQTHKQHVAGDNSPPARGWPSAVL